MGQGYTGVVVNEHAPQGWLNICKGRELPSLEAIYDVNAKNNNTKTVVIKSTSKE